MGIVFIVILECCVTKLHMGGGWRSGISWMDGLNYGFCRVLFGWVSYPSVMGGTRGLVILVI